MFPVLVIRNALELSAKERKLIIGALDLRENAISRAVILKGQSHEKVCEILT
jgi:hypothetical protein